MKPEPIKPANARAVPRLGFGGFVGLLQHRTDVRGLTIKEVRDDQAIDVPIHEHESAHFCCIMDAGYRSSARGADDATLQRQLLYHPPRTRHADRFLSRGGRFVSVHLTDGWLREAVDDCALPDVSQSYCGPAFDVIRERIRIECRRGDQASAMALEALVLELIHQAATRPARDEVHAAPWIDAAIEIIYDDPRESLSVSELARQVGVHPVVLARAFRRHRRASPGDFLRWRRMDRALALLRRSAPPLIDVALEAGFSDQTSFTRACRRIVGITPAAYRRLFSGGSRGSNRAPGAAFESSFPGAPPGSPRPRPGGS